jgi:small conductance mechanosensitive channel
MAYVSAAGLLAQDTEVDVDAPARLVESVESGTQSFLTMLPAIGIAAAIIAVAWLIARLLRPVLRRRWTRTRTPSFGEVFSNLAGFGIIALGVFIALPVAFPSVNVLSMLGGLGLLGIAAGFAFQDILSNVLSGILLILRQPFRSGDQITVADYTGTVQAITIRETKIKTYDGRVVYVPNKDVYTGVITVQTAEDHVRTSVIVGVDYDADLAQAQQVALDALADTDGVLADPAPQAFYTEFGASSINLDLRYWTSSRQADIRRVQGEVVKAIKVAYDRAGIDIPFDIVTFDTRHSFEASLVRASEAASTTDR